MFDDCWLQAAALAFTFTLAYDNGNEEFNGVKLNRFGMQEMVENVSYFTIRPPEKNSYRLIIYAKDLDQQVSCIITSFHLGTIFLIKVVRFNKT